MTEYVAIIRDWLEERGYSIKKDGIEPPVSVETSTELIEHLRSQKEGTNE